MFFRKNKSIELFFDLDFLNHIKPEKRVRLGILYAELSFYENESLIGSYLYPQDKEYFVIQYPEKWVLKFLMERCAWKNINNIKYVFTVVNDKNEIAMEKSGKVAYNV